MDPIDNSCGIRYNIKDTDQDEWLKAFGANLELYRDPLNKLMDTDNDISTEDLDRAADALTEAITRTNEQAAKVRNPSPSAKPWWNKKLSAAAANICYLRNLQIAYVEEHETIDPDLTTEIKRTRNFFV